MEEFINVAIGQVPGLCVLIYLVKHFLQTLKEITDDYKETTKENTAVLAKVTTYLERLNDEKDCLSHHSSDS